MDIPALNVEGARLVISNQASGRDGVYIFPSPDDSDPFPEAEMESSGELDGGPVDVAPGYRALVYERVTNLSPSMRREAMTRGWRVDSPEAYPLVECREPDGALRPVVERNVEIVAACAMSLGAFVLKHASIFSLDTFTPVCESYFDDDDLEVRFTFPDDALSDFDARAPLDDADGAWSSMSRSMPNRRRPSRSARGPRATPPAHAVAGASTRNAASRPTRPRMPTANRPPTYTTRTNDS